MSQQSIYSIISTNYNATTQQGSWSTGSGITAYAFPTHGQATATDREAIETLAVADAFRFIRERFAEELHREQREVHVLVGSVEAAERFNTLRPSILKADSDALKAVTAFKKEFTVRFLADVTDAPADSLLAGVWCGWSSPANRPR